MAVLEKMRKRMGVFISIVIAIALLAFIVNPEDLQRVAAMFSSKYDVGKIAGKSINQQEFSKRVDYYNGIAKLTGQTGSSEEENERANNEAWNSFVADNVLIPACEKAGIKIGESEIEDMCGGVDISPVLRSEAAFMDDNGLFSKDQFQHFIESIDGDETGQLAAYWGYLENNMMQERMFTKYAAMIAKSTIANKLQVRREIAENNNSYDVDFVIAPLSYERDTTVKVSNEEIKKYYEQIRPALKKFETRDGEIVVLPIEPSEKDVKAAQEEMEKLYEEFRTLPDAEMKAFLTKNSDTPFNDLFFKSEDLREVSAILSDFAADKKAGDFLETQHYDNQFVAAKILEVASRPDSVYLKYIPVADEKTADSLIAVLKGGADFTALASQYVQAQRGGEPGTLGWVTEPIVYANFPAAFMQSFTAKSGDLFKVDAGGYYVITKVDQLTKPVRKVKVAVLSRNATASQETFSAVYAEAGKVLDAAQKNIDKMEDYAFKNNIEVVPANGMVGGLKNIGSYDNMKEATRWMFDAKEGQISDIITVNNKYYVIAALKKIHPAGYASLEDMTPQVKEYLTVKKTVEHMADECKAKVGDATDLEAVSEKLNTTVSSINDVTFSSLSSGQQLDPLFVGYIAKAGAEGNKNIVGPVKGSLGVYYFQIKDNKMGAFYTESDAQNKADNAVYSILNVLPQVMCNDADVVDQRYKFY
jgi:peptidyl-prolyl cis-trans isomerase D